MNERSGPSAAELIEMRLLHLEQAYIALLERVMVLERGLRSEANTAQAHASVLSTLSGLPARVDRLEERARARRQPPPFEAD